MADGGAALLLGSRSQQHPEEFDSIELAHFSAAGVRLTSMPVLASVGPLRDPVRNVALDRNGALWMLRLSAGVKAQTGAGAKTIELAQIVPGRPLKTYPLDLPPVPYANVTAMECEPGLVWGAVSSPSIATVLQFQVASRTALSRTSSPGAWCYRFFRPDSSCMIAVYGMPLLGKPTITSSIHVLDNSLKPAGAATADGWIQDVAYTAAAGSAPAMLHVAATEDPWGSRSLSVETLAFPDLRRVSAQTWSEPDKIVSGSVFFVEANGAPVLVRMSATTLEVLSRALEPQAKDRVLAVPPPARKPHRVFPLRSGLGVRYLLQVDLLVNGRLRRNFSVSADLAAAVRG
jgi:hypothetical protein